MPRRAKRSASPRRAAEGFVRTVEDVTDFEERVSACGDFLLPSPVLEGASLRREVHLFVREERTLQSASLWKLGSFSNGIVYGD